MHRLHPSFPLAALNLALLLACVGIARGYRVGPALSLNQLAEEADLIFKGTVLSSGPVQDPWFEPYAGAGHLGPRYLSACSGGSLPSLWSSCLSTSSLTAKARDGTALSGAAGGLGVIETRSRTDRAHVRKRGARSGRPGLFLEPALPADH